MVALPPPFFSLARNAYWMDRGCIEVIEVLAEWLSGRGVTGVVAQLSADIQKFQSTIFSAIVMHEGSFSGWAIYFET